ncbi:MAG TPA: carbohydrate-binding family 9-like protein [Vicinamibacteria bacterium]|nr:carbohydrate-binding family 9-like protein [Vicinamibacteria bacterium]
MRPRTTSRVDRTVLRIVFVCFALAGAAGAASAASADASVIVSHRARADFALTADPGAAAWKSVEGVVAEKDRFGKVVPHHRTEVRSRWTDKNLYFLFIAPYDELYVKPNPTTAAETDKLWDWDVAEAFIGTDFKDIKKYKEFQVSPQAEWVDLAIDRGKDPPSHDVSWNSGYEVKARVDRDKHVWYGEMRIPLESIDVKAPKNGVETRINLYRCQGAPADRKYINWQTVNNETFHTPEAFGRLRLDN